MPGVLLIQTALGDALRREDRFAEAAAAYDAAVALVAKPEARHWGLYYSRAIAYERQQMWDKAEPDFRKALELNPDQPQVLNYLGYSLLERHERLEEALGLIERAVRAEPEAGYIVDSYAWALFRLGRYREAVEPMERASVLEPVDPVVTDHLGDVYWAVGRQMEARFQWRRALSFDPEEKDAVRIRKKLEVGLDAVLAEEGMKPLTEVANDGGQ
jgi:Flp pilus assembly protein TadD